ncbi:transposase [Streptomyces sp. NPDC058877]|uniref:transposase n=1 Tax=unclassified Streptomyces TaxID=2593676 RepID=UPI00368844CA
MGRGDPTDEQRAVSEPLLPKSTEAGRPWVRPRRRWVDGIRFRVRTGVPRRDVPSGTGRGAAFAACAALRRSACPAPDRADDASSPSGAC